jgi:hypothetical protein
MGLRSDSVAGVRFLAAVHEGRGIKPAAPKCWVHSRTGYRWLLEAFLVLRPRGQALRPLTHASSRHLTVGRPRFLSATVPTLTE